MRITKDLITQVSTTPIEYLCGEGVPREFQLGDLVELIDGARVYITFIIPGQPITYGVGITPFNSNRFGNQASEFRLVRAAIN